MIHRKILFLIIFINFLLASCALIKQDIKKNDVKKIKISEDKKITKVIEEKDTRDLNTELNFPEKNIKEIKPTKIKINNKSFIKRVIKVPFKNH